MSSPTRAKVSWKIAKSTVLRQKKHIRQLQQINRRLRMKITSLKSLLQYFKDNKYITESAESVIQVNIIGVLLNFNSLVFILLGESNMYKEIERKLLLV